MNNCLELFYDQFRLDFYLAQGVTGDGPLCLVRRALSVDSVQVDELTRLFSVGRFAQHTDTCIRANDKRTEVTTKVEESKSDEYYEVSVHFEFQNPSINTLNLCTQLLSTPCVVMVRFLGADGNVASSRLIRPANEAAQSVQFSESAGVTSVDLTLYSVNGIQALL